jgi:hypothetical protein
VAGWQLGGWPVPPVGGAALATVVQLAAVAQHLPGLADVGAVGPAAPVDVGGRAGAGRGVGRVVAEGGHQGVEGVGPGWEEVHQGSVGGVADGGALVGRGALGGWLPQAAAEAAADRLGVVGRPGIVNAGVDHGQRPGGDRRRRPGVADRLQGGLVPEQDDVIAPRGDPFGAGGGHRGADGDEGREGEQRGQPGGGRAPGEQAVAHRGLLGLSRSMSREIRSAGAGGLVGAAEGRTRAITLWRSGGRLAAARSLWRGS